MSMLIHSRSGPCQKEASARSFWNVRMNKLVKSVFLLVSVIFFAGQWVLGEAETKDSQQKITHADAAVILAKYTGYFDRYVDESDDLNECVTFLNKTGIYFGLLEIVNGSEFSVKDAARSFGQIDLVLSGDGKFSGGKVLLPKGVESWEEYCTMNRIDYEKSHQTMLEVLRIAYELRK